MHLHLKEMDNQKEACRSLLSCLILGLCMGMSRPRLAAPLRQSRARVGGRRRHLGARCHGLAARILTGRCGLSWPEPSSTCDGSERRCELWELPGELPVLTWRTVCVRPGGTPVHAWAALASEERGLVLCCRVPGRGQHARRDGASGRSPHLREHSALPTAGRAGCGQQRREQPQEGPL